MSAMCGVFPLLRNQCYGPEMASACRDGSMSSDEDELGIDSLERLVDERLAAITNK